MNKMTFFFINYLSKGTSVKIEKKMKQGLCKIRNENAFNVAILVFSLVRFMILEKAENLVK